MKLTYLVGIAITCALFLTTACAFINRAKEESGQLLATVAPALVTNTPNLQQAPTLYSGTPAATAKRASVTIEATVREVPPTPQPPQHSPPLLKVNENQSLYLYAEASTAEPLFILPADQELVVQGYLDNPRWYLVCCPQASMGNLEPMWIDGGENNVNKFTIQNQERLSLFLPITPTPTVDSAKIALAEVMDGQSVALVANLGDDFTNAVRWLPGIPLEITGFTVDKQWYRVCCLDGEDRRPTMWFHAADLSKIHFDEETVRLKATPVVPPTPSPVPSPFSRARGPEYWQTDHSFLAILVKVYVGEPPNEEPLPGYLLAAEFQPIDQTTVQKRLNQTSEKVSIPQFSRTVGDNLFNYKFEYRDELGTGSWKIWLTNAEGYNLWLQDDPFHKDFQLSEEITFTLDPSNPNKEIYIAWIRVR